MKLKLGFSPCPNDTFIFDALVNGKLHEPEIEFETVITDVEQLNKMAFEEIPDITKISIHAYAYVSHKYAILGSGSALGYGNGPLVISKRKIYPNELAGCLIAIPGRYTTANLLFGLAFPETVNKKEYLFSDIEEAVLSNEADVGVIIHENRFTYHLRGLKKITDLGEYWESETHMPIPLGCIAVKRSLPEKLKDHINILVHDSVVYAFQNPGSSENFVRKHAQEMEPEIMKKHIELYVNDFTIDLGEKGRNAINTLFQTARGKNVIPELYDEIFL
ncbi:MAG: 1,4-dihydroxy-6-naphthoate synthase [Bacteroidia bacterium]|nr:1,4-dihydroxy-6-naphthoate synthase [Bacteroidia bacterium]